MPLIRTLVPFLLLAALAATAWGQDLPADSSVSARDSADSILPQLEGLLGEITVTSSRLRIDVAEAPQRVTVLSRADIERTGARHVGELLAARSGFFIRQYGDGLATMSVRGASPSQTMILLDGMRLSDPQLGQLDLSLFPTYALGAVEVMHGPGSALYGSDGIGGIVNLRPLKAQDTEVRLSSEVGAFGERRLGGGGSWREEAAGGVVGAEYAEAAGDFPYVDESLFPAREVRRRNADRRTRSLYASSFLRTGDHRFEAAVLLADAVRGLPGLATVRPPGERQWDTHLRIWISDEIVRRSGRMSVRGFVHRSVLRYRNPSLGIDDTGRTWSGAIEGERVVPISTKWVLDGGLAAGFAQAEHPMLTDASTEMHGAAFVEAVGTVRFASVYPAVRVDAYGLGSDMRRVALSPRLGVNVPMLDRHVRLKAGVGRAFRNPTFNERYWQPGGNPNLAPERAWSVESGIHVTSGDYGGLRSPSLSGEITVLSARTLDQIVWSPQSAEIWVPDNVAETITFGMEASVRAGAATGAIDIDGGATYSLTHSVDRSERGSRTFDRQLRYVPRHLIKGFAGAALGALRIDVNARWIGRRYVTADESEWLEPALVVSLHAGARRDIGGLHAELGLVLENASNARYAIIQNYPMPPRHARVRLILQTRSDSK